MKSQFLLSMALGFLIAASANADLITSYDQKKGFLTWQKDLSSCGTDGSGVRTEKLHDIRLHVCARAYNDHPAVELAGAGGRTNGDVASEVSSLFYPMYNQCVKPNYKAPCQELVNDENSVDADGPSTHQKYHHKNISVDLKAPVVGFDDLLVDDAYAPYDKNCEAKMVLSCLKIMTQRHANAVASKNGKNTHWRVYPTFETAADEWIGDYPAKTAGLKDQQSVPPPGFTAIPGDGLPPFLKKDSK